MSIALEERFEVLRDEALNSSEFGDDAPGAEIFDTIINRIAHLGESSRGETESDLDLSLQDSLSRRLAWGEDAAAVIADCGAVSNRILEAVRRSFPSSDESIQIVSIVTDVTCAAYRYISMVTVQRSGKERSQHRREMMVQRQLASELEKQEILLEQINSKSS